MRHTKIVCTMGPASESVQVQRRMIEAGMNVARYNFSHGTHEDHARRIKNTRQAAKEVGSTIALMLDTKGPEIRLGTFRQGKVFVKEGDLFVITTRPIEGTEREASVLYQGLPQDVEAGHFLLLDDGNIRLEVLEVKGSDIICRVLNGGSLSDHKKVNVPEARLSLPALSEQDVADLRFGVQQGVDFVAASFVRKAADVIAIRRVLEEAGGDAHIIAKIESKEGVENLDEILKVADGLMVARGDLGVEIPTEEVPLLQKKMIEKCNRLGKPVITATQMLESMVERPRPTRAEASDVANAIFDGTDAVMLSAETAAGKYPVEAVSIMASIAERTEEALPYREILAKRGSTSLRTVTDAISHATCSTAQDLGARAILTATQSGYTARMVAKYRPRSPILAMTPVEAVRRKLALVWGVHSLPVQDTSNTDEMIETAVLRAKEAGAIADGDLVVITAGIPVGIAGTTNLLKVHTVGDILVRGVGIGNRSVSGRVAVIRTTRETARFQPGDILVTLATDRDFVPLMEKAAAVVAEEGGLTSHAAVVGLSLGIPVIVGAEGATGILKNGQLVTIDGTRGLVYRGEARVL
ncbi:MAG: pyruvate kinase [Firmicutes bacterium]|nr:pyruvate kinase [Bacillota bacterium]